MSERLTETQIRKLRQVVLANKMRESSQRVHYMFVDVIDELLDARQRLADLEAENARLRDREAVTQRVSDRSMDSFDYYSLGGDYQVLQERREREQLAKLKLKYGEGE